MSAAAQVLVALATLLAIIVGAVILLAVTHAVTGKMLDRLTSDDASKTRELTRSEADATLALTRDALDLAREQLREQMLEAERRQRAQPHRHWLEQLYAHRANPVHLDDPERIPGALAVDDVVCSVSDGRGGLVVAIKVHPYVDALRYVVAWADGSTSTVPLEALQLVCP